MKQSGNTQGAESRASEIKADVAVIYFKFGSIIAHIFTLEKKCFTRYLS